MGPATHVPLGFFGHEEVVVGHHGDDGPLDFLPQDFLGGYDVGVLITHEVTFSTAR